MTLLVDDCVRQAGSAGPQPLIDFKTDSFAASEVWNGVAARIDQFRAAGLARGDRVAILMRKGPGAIEALLAALMLGAIAVPIDPKSPASRAAAMISDVEPAIAVAEEDLWRAVLQSNVVLPGIGRTITTSPDRPAASAGLNRAFGADLPPLAAQDAALILMTSGTTGPPKGVTITHGNITAFSDWAIDHFALSAEDRFLNVAPLHFDLALLDVLTALRLGARVTVTDDASAMFPAHLAGLIERHRITVLYTVPTVLRAMVSRGGLKDRKRDTLRWILYAGETYPPAALRELMAAVPSARFANLFGPTETNVISCKIIEQPPGLDEPPNIGSPCSHGSVTICDEFGRQVEGGTLGEICVTGPTVMQGYWRRRDLTGDRYFSDRPGLFRTGDYGYSDGQGEIRFCGRRDRQVKLLGHRVELQNVEAAAATCANVSAAAVTFCDRGETLCLHVAMKPPARLDETGLRRELNVHLSRRELPHFIVDYRLLPTTSTGKIDLRALSVKHANLLAEGHGQE